MTRSSPPSLRAIALVLGIGALLAWLLCQTISFGAQPHPRLPLLQLLVVLVATGSMAIAIAFRHAIAPLIVLALYSAALAVCASALFDGGPFALNGLQGDAWFCVTAAARFADTWAYQDFCYKDLPSYYAPFFFWLAGRVGQVLGAAPMEIWKYAVIVAAFVAPVFAYSVTWRTCRRCPWTALTAAVLLTVVWGDELLYKPHSFFANVGFAAWAIAFVGSPPKTWPGLLKGAVLGGLLFQTYYYPFFVLLPLLALMSVARASGRTAWQFSLGWRSGVLLAGAAVCAMPFWAPLALSLGEGSESVSNRWFQDRHLAFWTPVGPQITVAAVVGFLGLAVVSLRNGRRARCARLLFVAALAWYAICFASAVVFDVPLLHFRTEGVVEATLAPFAAIGLAELAAAAARRARSGAAVRRVTAVLGLIGLAALTQSRLMRTYGSELYENTRRDAQGPPALAPNLSQQLRSRVVLGGLAARPLAAAKQSFCFLAPNAYFSHPAARFSQRLEFVRSLAKAESQAAFVQMLRQNPFEPIDFLLLTRVARGSGQGAFLEVYEDHYPKPASKTRVHFPARLLRGQLLSVEETPLGPLFEVRAG